MGLVSLAVLQKRVDVDAAWVSLAAVGIEAVGGRNPMVARRAGLVALDAPSAVVAFLALLTLDAPEEEVGPAHFTAHGGVAFAASAEVALLVGRAGAERDERNERETQPRAR
jgi:hypothetical protein